MNEREKLYLLAEALDGCSDRVREQLLRRYRDAAELIAAAGDEFLSEELTSARLEKLLELSLRQLEAHGVTLLTREDARYPHALYRLKNPPRVLYALGNLELLHTDCLAVVGTRDCSPEAYARVRGLACEAARAGYTVVSGMALGCDAAAHRGALDADGGTIAVLAGSVRDIYPRENAVLYREILERGLILSETPEGARIYPASFLKRNRIVAGLSRAVLVTYARERSGTWSTARHAVKCGSRLLLLRDAAEALPEFAKGVGAAIDDPQGLLAELARDPNTDAQTGMFDSEPCFSAKQGDAEVASEDSVAEAHGADRISDGTPYASALQTEQADDPLESAVRHEGNGFDSARECDPAAVSVRQNAAHGSEEQSPQAEESREEIGDEALLNLLKYGERTFTELIEATGLQAKRLQIRLFLLEMDGKACRLPGNRFLAK